ncbi:hypothetical protein QT970_12670 [Microcoleus sp. herbarium8]|uniref:hypothetical protein n=1 Tax=Microcoleus sp. herbarium8 TaxID=3055436 RepID=UPI002FD37DBC
MIEPTAANRPELKAWIANSLRMTAILSPAAQLPKHSLWEEVFGQPPENITSQPRTGVQQEDGSFEGGRLSVTVQPARVDWMLTVDNNQATNSPIPSIGQFVDVLNLFADKMTHWLEMSPPLQRLAFGSILLLPMDEESSARQQLFAYLPLNPQNFENAQEFLYQINRPRNSISGISNLLINRLSKWSVIRWKTINFLPTNLISYSESPDSFSCCIELDINTSPDYQENLPKEKLSQIFLELVDLGKEIVKEGDIS